MGSHDDDQDLAEQVRLLEARAATLEARNELLESRLRDAEDTMVCYHGLFGAHVEKILSTSPVFRAVEERCVGEVDAEEPLPEPVGEVGSEDRLLD